MSENVRRGPTPHSSSSENVGKFAKTSSELPSLCLTPTSKIPRCKLFDSDINDVSPRTRKSAMNPDVAAAPRDRLHQSNKKAQKSCAPCRTRKVKCDRASPCGRCIQSGYPSLCIYNARTGNLLPVPWGPLRRRAEEVRLSAQSSSLARWTQETETLHLRTPTTSRPEQGRVGDQITKSPYLGANSLFQFTEDETAALEEVTRQGARDVMMPMLGASAPPVSGYPFYISSEGLEEQAVARLHRSLPPSRVIIRLFQTYQNEVHPFAPLLVRGSHFETELCAYVQGRRDTTVATSSDQQSQTQDLQQGMPMAWVSILFALMACGAQFGDEIAAKRQEQSSLYVSCAFEALRLANALMSPTVHCVQAMFLIGSVLQNDMRPQAAWTLLGSTIRMAQGLGIHKAKDGESLQRRLWLALVRQDGLLSICFDRRTSSPLGTAQLDSDLSSHLSHKTAMDHMTDLVLRSNIVADESNHPNLRLRRDLTDAIDAIKRRTQTGSAHDLELSDIQNQCQRHHLELQFGFVKACVCRPALRGFDHFGADSPDAALRDEVVAICLQSLRDCLYAFMRLDTLCNYATRSWSALHNGLSSSLLLALMGELTRDSHLHATLRELLDIFEAGDTASGGEDSTMCNGTHLASAHIRAVVALRRMCLRDSILPESGRNISTMSDTIPCQRYQDAVNSVGPTQHSKDPLDGDFASNAAADPNLWQDFNSMSRVSPLDAFDNILWSQYQDTENTLGDDLEYSWLT